MNLEYQNFVDEENIFPQRKQDLYSQTGFMGKLFFSWVTKLIELAQTKQLTVNDLDELPPHEKVEYNFNKFSIKWEELRGDKQRLKNALY